jgi:leucyl-tRNA synthetase
MPVAQYVGGIEHAILHLLYSRFFTKVLFDLGMIDFVEPFMAQLNQGSVVLNGAAMSKSKGNMVELGDELAAHGVDAVRTTMLFASPPEDDVDWADVSAAGQTKWLARVWRIAIDVGAAATADGEGDIELRKLVHRVIDDGTRLIEGFRLNVVIARLMELTNALRKAIDSGAGAGEPALRFGAETLAVMLAPFAPYTAEKCWARLKHEPSVHQQRWPEADPAMLVQDSVTCVVQIAGKVRERLEVSPDITEAELHYLAVASVAGLLEGHTIKKAIVRPPKLVNFVI